MFKLNTSCNYDFRQGSCKVLTVSELINKGAISSNDYVYFDYNGDSYKAQLGNRIIGENGKYIFSFYLPGNPFIYKQEDELFSSEEELVLSKLSCETLKALPKISEEAFQEFLDKKISIFERIKIWFNKFKVRPKNYTREEYMNMKRLNNYRLFKKGLIDGY